MKIYLKRTLSISESKLPNNQFGSRQNHSTMHQLHWLVDQISFTLKVKIICTGAFLDISQVLDRVLYQGLFYKLNLLHIFTYYLNCILKIDIILYVQDPPYLKYI